MRVFRLEIALSVLLVGFRAFSQEAIPDNSHSRELQALVGQTIWYAPYLGCLDKVSKEPTNKGPTERFIPEKPMPLVIKELKFSHIYGYRFEMLSGATYVGGIAANDVLGALKFPPSDASKFFRECYFAADPALLEAGLRNNDRIGFSVYTGYSPDGRQDEIKRMLDLDKWNFETARKFASQAKKPGVKVGMTRDQVRKSSSWGEPLSINTTIMAGHKSEQWVYGDNQYLYFTNGRLTAIQK